MEQVVYCERQKDEKFSGTAIVCGGSISGLLSAKVCANHFSKVIIIEVEGWVVGEKGMNDYHREPDAPKRARVAQYTSLHYFQAIVTLVMKEMFTTFEQAHESIAGKLGVAFDIFHVSGVPRLISPRFPVYSGGVHPASICMTRPALETTTRRLLLETCKEVEILHGTVIGLVYDENLNRVSGVNVKLPNGETTELEGTLVVDATGAFMGGHRWLKAIPKYANYRSPSLDDVKLMFDPKVRYTQAEFALPPKLDEAFRKYGLSN